MQHCEEFEIVASPDGCNVVKEKIFCATAYEHYVKTTHHVSSNTKSEQLEKEEELNKSVSNSNTADNKDTEDQFSERNACDIDGKQHIYYNNSNSDSNNTYNFEHNVVMPRNNQELHNCLTEGDDICKTGLRVYEGAQLLSAFVYQYAELLLCKNEYLLSESDLEHISDYNVNLQCKHTCECQEANKNSKDKFTNIIIELGCGCGLVGFTLMEWLHEQQEQQKQQSQNSTEINYRLEHEHTILFTDASLECLSLVRHTATLFNMNKCTVVNDFANNFANSFYEELLNIDNNDYVKNSNVNKITDVTRDRLYCEEANLAKNKTLCMTYPLQWNNEGPHKMWEQLNICFNNLLKPYPVLILGSDLMYYRVDVEELLQTVKQLILEPQESLGCANKIKSKHVERMRTPFVVFAHFMRIPNGRHLLASTARRLGFGIVSIESSCCVNSAILHERGWNGLEIVMLFVQSANVSRKNSTCSSSSSSSSCAFVKGNGTESVEHKVTLAEEETLSHLDSDAYHNLDPSLSDVAVACELVTQRKLELLRIYALAHSIKHYNSNNDTKINCDDYLHNLLQQKTTRLLCAITPYPPQEQIIYKQSKYRNGKENVLGETDADDLLKINLEGL